MLYKVLFYIYFLSNIAIFSQKIDFVSIDSNKTKLYFNENLLDSVTIYGFGEPTHGTKESFLYKNEFIKYLIENNKINAVGFEFSFIRGLLIDYAICNNKNDYMQYLEGTWQYTKSIYSLLDWIRKYNLKNNKNIHIFGFDIFTDRLLFNKYISLENKSNNIDSISFNSFIEIINAKKNGTLKIDNFKDNINIIDTIFQITSNFKLSNNSRDSLMYRIINWNIDRYSSVIISAHNAHISKATFVENGFLSLGYHLNENYKNKYVTFGFILGKGSYRANDIDGVKIFNIPTYNKKSVNKCFLNKYNSDTLIFYKDFPICKKKLNNVFIVGAGSSNNKKILTKNFVKVKKYNKAFDFFIFLKNTTASNSFLEKNKDFFMIEELFNEEFSINSIKVIIKYKSLYKSEELSVFIKTYKNNKFQNYLNKKIDYTNSIDSFTVDIDKEITSIKFGFVAINEVDINISEICLVVNNEIIRKIDLPKYSTQLNDSNSNFVINEIKNRGIRVYKKLSK